jgi:hypothetical protein
MRELTSHKVNGLNEALKIEVFDEPGPGNACHEYQIAPVAYEPAEGDVAKAIQLSRAYCRIHFQTGPIAEAGVNGVSNEALLAIVEDRLLGFQAGAFACESNARALYHVQAAMEALRLRTQERLARGVEGTNVK